MFHFCLFSLPFVPYSVQMSLMIYNYIFFQGRKQQLILDCDTGICLRLHQVGLRRCLRRV